MLKKAILTTLVVVTFPCRATEKVDLTTCWARLNEVAPTFFSSRPPINPLQIGKIYSDFPSTLLNTQGSRKVEVQKLAKRLEQVIVRNNLAYRNLGRDGWEGALTWLNAVERWALSLVLQAIENESQPLIKAKAVGILSEFLEKGIRVVRTRPELKIGRTLVYGGGPGILCGFAVYSLGSGSNDKIQNLALAWVAGIGCTAAGGIALQLPLPVPTPKNRVNLNSHYWLGKVKDLPLPAFPTNETSLEQLVSGLVGRTLYEITANPVEAEAHVIGDLRSLLDFAGNTEVNRRFLIDAYMQLAYGARASSMTDFYRALNDELKL